MDAHLQACPICGSEERQDALGRADALCSGCGSLERHRALVRANRELLDAGQGKCCLEAGPATPFVYGGFLRERGWEYKCVDRWRTGNPKDPRAVGFIDYETDLRDLSMFGDDEFDLFLAQHVIEEIEDYKRALEEIARVLRPGGSALVEIPFDAARERSEHQPPDHFGNVWVFGRDLLDQLRVNFSQVEEIAMAEGSYSGTLLACTASEGDKGAPATAIQSSSIAENRLPGDGSWWAGDKAPDHTLEGYASWPSVEPGGRLELHVSTRPAARYRVSIHRLGWYGGEGGRVIAEYPRMGDLQGAAQPIPGVGAGPSIVSSGWPVTDVVPIGRDWASGQYVAKLTLTDGDSKGAISFVPFVVRAPLDYRADILIQMPVTTAQAYNNWGGKSLYPSNSSDGIPAIKVSFDRPFLSWHEANLNSRWPFIWDIQLIRFLEREGYDVSYTTDLDTHREPWGLLGHPLVMTSGHDEYWSKEMRDAFESIRAGGASLAFMGANTCYWQARFEDEDRTMAEYRRAQADPEPEAAVKTVRFRDLDPPRPECLLLGVQYQDGLDPPGAPPRDYQLTESCLGDPWLEGTGFERGADLKGLVGYEWDALPKDSPPPNATVFFHHKDELSNADAVRHRSPAGGIVFAAGSLQFSWGLDDWGQPGHADPRLQRLIKNGLDEMIAAGRESIGAPPAEQQVWPPVSTEEEPPTDKTNIERDLPLPPAEMRYMGESDERFLAVGGETVADLRDLVNLSDSDRVIDIGCGYGRLAHALLRDPRYRGEYLGLDILSGPIEWCQRELAPRSEDRAAFREIDVANARYNPDGSTPGHLAALGVEAESFDVAALISVFTHLDPPTIERYLLEIANALAPEGRAFISAFLLEDSWRAREEAGDSPLPMPHELTPFCRYHNPDDPLAAIGYSPDWLIAKVEASGLRLISPPRLGTWCGRKDGVGYQDVIALRRATGPA